jgi:hypothetical protein
MSVYQGSCGNWAEYRQSRRRRPGAWRPLELAAMIAGFFIYWPVGLAILLLKMWQRREGHAGDLFSYAQEKVMTGAPANWQGAMRDKWNAFEQRGFGGFGMRSTGNAAFDEWRATELERLEAERRKLAEAEREFAEHLDRLRKARDREEFERFMAERNARQSGPAPSA